MAKTETTPDITEATPPAPDAAVPTPAEDMMAKLLARIEELEASKTVQATQVTVTADIKPAIPEVKGVTVNQWRNVLNGLDKIDQIDKREQFYESSVFDRMLVTDDAGRSAFENLGMGFEIIDDTRTK